MRRLGPMKAIIEDDPAEVTYKDLAEGKLFRFKDSTWVQRAVYMRVKDPDGRLIVAMTGGRFDLSIGAFCQTQPDNLDEPVEVLELVEPMKLRGV